MIYGSGAVLGFTPQDVDMMSFWQWQAAVAGYAKAHSPKSGNTLSEAEKDELWLLVDRGSDGPRTLSTITYWWDERGPVPIARITFNA